MGQYLKLNIASENPRYTKKVDKIYTVSHCFINFNFSFLFLILIMKLLMKNFSNILKKNMNL